MEGDLVPYAMNNKLFGATSKNMEIQTSIGLDCKARRCAIASATFVNQQCLQGSTAEGKCNKEHKDTWSVSLNI